MGIVRARTREQPKPEPASTLPASLERGPAINDRRSITVAEKALVDLLRREGGLTKSSLAIHSEFSRAKVTACINSLLQKKIVVINKLTAYSGGRRSKSFRLNEGLCLVAGIQIGAVDLDLGVADFSGKLLAQRSEPGLVKEGPISTLGSACSTLEKLLAELGKLPESLLAIGIGVPGPVDFDAGTVVSPPIMPGWDQYPIIATVRQWFPRASVVVDNDVNVMALGEVSHGAARGVANLLAVKIGTGIGAGIICEGRIYRGSSGCAGDIGHICVDADGPVCACGNKGCLEKIAGGAGIAERALAGARSGRSPILLQRYEANAGQLSAKDVGAAAIEGDEFAIEVVRDTGRHIGEVLAALVNFYNPDMIVIGGGVSRLGNILLSSIRQAVFNRSLPLATRNLQIVFSGMGSDAGTLGAISLGLNHVLKLQPEGASGTHRLEMEPA